VPTSECRKIGFSMEYSIFLLLQRQKKTGEFN
jgi:hypothetical protein